LKITNLNKLGFCVYSYYQARDIINILNNFNIKPFIIFNHNIVDKLGIVWIKEVYKLLTKDFGKKNLRIVLDCKKNPALAISCIRYGFSYIIFDGNNILQRKIQNIGKKNKVVINPDIKIFNLKNIKNCNKYILRLMKLQKRKK